MRDGLGATTGVTNVVAMAWGWRMGSQSRERPPGRPMADQRFGMASCSESRPGPAISTDLLSMTWQITIKSAESRGDNDQNPGRVPGQCDRGHRCRACQAGGLRRGSDPAGGGDRQEASEIRCYYEIGTDFAGMEPGAVWEDFRVGVEYWTRWERVAVVTDVAWIKHVVNAFRFLMPGQLRVFPTGEKETARAWVEAP